MEPEAVPWAVQHEFQQLLQDLLGIDGIIRSENICKPNYQYTTRVQRRTYFYTVFPRSTYLFYPTYR